MTELEAKALVRWRASWAAYLKAEAASHGRRSWELAQITRKAAEELERASVDLYAVSEG